MNNRIYSPKVSIIIPLYVICERFFKDLERFNKIHYHNYEILIICDKKIQIPKKRHIKLVITGQKKTGPAEKRDIGVSHAKGEICAFIDDDAYPDIHWIGTAVKHFIANKNIIAVGGPGLTPPDDSYMAKLGGLVYESKLTSGKLQMRFLPIGSSNQQIFDWPAYNFFIRKSVIKKVGGWGSMFYGGEDTFICYKMLKHGKMIYEPKSIVYHHRRELFKPHLQQIYNVGVHRGYFFKKYPETSRHILYLMPTALTTNFFLLAFLSLFFTKVLISFILILSILFLVTIKLMNTKVSVYNKFIVFIGILLTHMAYGIGFIKGILINNLIR
mgnify:CR=1 FL=1